MNYRSVMVFGRADAVDDLEEKRAALRRARRARRARPRRPTPRPPTDAELRKTLGAALPITEASAKVRTGGPIDDEEDIDLPMWAGQLPLTTVFADPVADSSGVPRLPDYVRDYRRP